MSLHGLVLPFLIHLRYFLVEYRWKNKLILEDALFYRDLHCFKWFINFLMQYVSHKKVDDFRCEVYWKVFIGIHALELLKILVRERDNSGFEDLDIYLRLDEINAITLKVLRELVESVD